MSKGFLRVIAVFMTVFIIAGIFYGCNNNSDEDENVVTDPQGMTYLAIDGSDGKTYAGVTDAAGKLYAAPIDDDGNVRTDGDLYEVTDYDGTLPTNDTTAVPVDDKGDGYNYADSPVVTDENVTTSKVNIENTKDDPDNKVTTDSQGNTNPNGDNSSNGTTGNNGNSNSNGTTGNNGNSNSNGTTGNNGNSNSNGTTGNNGNSNSNGTTGNNGNSNSNGTTGNNGNSNSNGTTGNNGNSNSNGTTGNNGSSSSNSTTGNNGNSSSNSTTGNSGSNNSDLLAEKYKKLFASGTYYIEFSSDDMEEPVTAAVKNENIYMKTKLEGMNCTMIYQKKKDNLYVVLDDYRVYCKMPSTMLEELDMSQFGNSNAVVDATVYDATIGNRKCRCEAYKLDNGGISIYYFYQGSLVRMDQVNEDGTSSVMNISKVSSSVDDSLFELPKGFIPFNLSKLDLDMFDEETTTASSKK